MPGNPYRLVMLFIALGASIIAVLFTVFALTAADLSRAVSAWAVVYWAAPIAGFWFTLWLIISAARWQPSGQR